jgi:uncharacterized damage-inducible protein DinB
MTDRTASPSYFQHLARYNTWANGLLYAACAALPAAEYHRARPSFFGSIHATLNHLLVADRIWFGRITGNAPDIALNAELYADLPSLRTAREAEDARIETLVQGMSEADLLRPVRYGNSSGKTFADPLVELLPHVFNHQTHHRGQVHDMLSQTDVAPPSLDLIAYQRGRR